MKDRFLMFIIGCLVGAIITTLCFVFLIRPNDRMDMPNRGERPGKMQWEEGEKPEKPDNIGNNMYPETVNTAE